MASRRTSKIKKLLFGLIALMFGGGTSVWGWLDPEAPFVGAIVQKLRGTGESGALSPLLSIGSKKDPFVSAGTFEVTLAKVSVDSAELRQGHNVDLQMKVSKKDASGQLQMLWDSRYAGERTLLVGHEPVSTTWSDRPFQVTWKPGEDFVIELWDRKAFFDKSIFLLETSTGDREFPLRPDTKSFAHLANGKRVSNPALNVLRIEAKRVSDEH